MYFHNPKILFLVMATSSGVPSKRPVPPTTGAGLSAGMSTVKRAKYSCLVKKSTRNHLETFYNPVDQPPSNGFWPGTIFPSKNAKDEAQRRLFPPLGMSFLSGVEYEWLEPDVVTPNVCDWLRFVTNANRDLICREFEEENVIRSLMKNDPDTKLRMSNNVTTMYVDASIYFRDGSVHFGSWSLYGRLLMFLDRRGYELTRSMITRSHVLSFVSTRLPSLMVSHAVSNANGVLSHEQRAVAQVVNDMITMFVVTRNALYGYDGDECKVPVDSVAGKMALTVSRNCGQRLRSFIKHDNTIKTCLLGPIQPDNVDRLALLGLRGPSITMNLLFDALRVDQRLRDIQEYWDAHEEQASDKIVSKGFDVTIVPVDAVHALLDELVKHLYIECDGLLSPAVTDGNIGYACCLIAVLYGGRSMGVLGCDEITPLGDSSDADDQSDGRDCVKRLVNICSLDNMLVVRSTCKDYKLRGVVDSSGLGLDDAGSCTRIALWEMLVESFHRVYPNSDDECSGFVAFFCLLHRTRFAICKDMYIDGDGDWQTYDVKLSHNFNIGVGVLNNPDKSVANFRSRMSNVYTMMKNVCNDVLGKYTDIPLSGTHALRRLYVSIAYARYADEKMTMASFIRVNLGHTSSNSSHAYDNIRVVGYEDKPLPADGGGDKDDEVDKLKTEMAEMKNEMTGMKEELFRLREHVNELQQKSELASISRMIFDKRIDANDAQIDALHHHDFLMADHVDTLRRLEWRVDDLEAKM